MSDVDSSGKGWAWGRSGPVEMMRRKDWFIPSLQTFERGQLVDLYGRPLPASEPAPAVARVASIDHATGVVIFDTDEEPSAP